MLKKTLFSFAGVVIGNIIVIGVIGLVMFISKSQIETRRFWEAVSWFKYSIILHVIQIFIFVLIIKGISRIIKFEFIKPKVNFLILGFLYSSVQSLLLCYAVIPLFSIMHENKNTDFFMEKISKAIHLPFVTISELIVIPFAVFIGIVSVYNYFLRNNMRTSENETLYVK